MVHSAHVTTYGERAVDTFYVTDLLGGKVEFAGAAAAARTQADRGGGRQNGDGEAA